MDARDPYYEAGCSVQTYERLLLWLIEVISEVVVQEVSDVWAG